MNLFLFGYGKLGKAIADSAKRKGHEIVGYTTASDLNESLIDVLKQADVAIEVSTPATAVQNIKTSIEHHVPVVVGTTGWYEHYDSCVDFCNDKNGAMLCATNFSIGVNLFFELNKNLAKIMDKHGYDTSMQEIHHIHKLDSPSGTAITLANDVISQNSALESWQEGETNDSKVLPIESLRSGEVPGTHIINYKSSIDSISIKHEAHNREGFANGAVIAAEWLQGKKGVFSMQDVISVKKS